MSTNLKLILKKMADKVTVELNGEYAEHLELLKQIIPSAT